MASYVINEEGAGYTRAQFENALLGKQDVLVSGQNIKTIDGNSVLGSGNLVVNGSTPPTPQEYKYNLNATEQGLQTKAGKFLNTVNPVKNGKRKYFSFLFLTDLHECYENIGYFGTVMTSEHAIKLAGSIAHDLGVSAVFCGGDLSTGASLSYEQYTSMLNTVKGYFDKYISVPHFLTRGNHDFKYDKNTVLRDNQTWLTFLKSFNSTGAVYFADQSGHANDSYTHTSYIVDFSDYKIRVFFRDNYESAQEALDNDRIVYNGDTPGYNFNTYSYSYNNSELFPSDKDYTFMGVSHFTGGSFMTDTSVTRAKFLQYLDGGGTGVIGEITGHIHPMSKVVVDEEDDKNYFKFIASTNVFAPKSHMVYDADGLPSSADESDYTFCLFVIDTDDWKLKVYKIADSWRFKKSTGNTTVEDTDSEAFRTTLMCDGDELPVYIFDIRHN